MSVEQISQDLYIAHQKVRSIDPVRGRIATLDQAYQVQAWLMAKFISDDNPIVGRKVGLTSVAVQQQLGVQQPDFGLLLRDMQVSNNGVVEIRKLVQPKAEAEIAFVLGADITDPRQEAVVDAIDYMTAAIEIVDSRIHNWDIRLFDTVADNASSALFVLSESRISYADLDLKEVRMTLLENGHPKSEGIGANCLGDPINALQWVAKTAIDQENPLRAGQVVLSGALGPMVTMKPNAEYQAVLQGFSTVKIITEG